MHILTNISRSNYNQAMKHFSWKIIHKMWWRNFSQTLFWKIKIEHISGSKFWSFIYFVFIVCQVEDFGKWLKLSCGPLAFTSSKAFIKNKKRSGTSLPVSLFTWYLKKNISVVIFYYLTKFQCLFTLRVLNNMGIAIVC